MTLVERLIKAGHRPECALEDAQWYLTQGGGLEALERYVEEVEGRVSPLQSQSQR